MKKVKYIKDVTSPSDRRGNAGETKELSENAARRLAAEGFVKILADKPKSAPAK